MSNELTESVDSYIKRVLPQAAKEFKFIKSNDWSEVSNVKSRASLYKVQNLLVDRNVKTAVKLYKMAGEDVGSKRVKSSLKTLIAFYKVLDERYKTMIDRFDWTSFNLEDEKEATKAELEVAFQSAVLDDVNSLENQLRTINFGDESDEIHIAMHGETPIPFMMKEAIEEQFPEIDDYRKKQAKKK